MWRVHGDNGIAYIELEPTTASGTVAVNFNFQDGEVTRAQRVGNLARPRRPSLDRCRLCRRHVGFNRLEEGLETLVEDGDQLNVDGRIALYAKVG